LDFLALSSIVVSTPEFLRNSQLFFLRDGESEQSAASLFIHRGFARFSYKRRITKKMEQIIPAENLCRGHGVKKWGK